MEHRSGRCVEDVESEIARIEAAILACADRQGATSLRGTWHTAQVRAVDGAREILVAPVKAEQIELFP